MQSKECPVLSTLSHGLPQPTMIFVFKKKIKKNKKKDKGGFWKLNGGGVLESSLKRSQVSV